MKRSQSILLFFIACLLFPAVAHAQPWSGILSPARAADWTGAGVVGGIRSGSWTQCGATVAPYTGTAARINSAIAGCGTNQYVLLGSGTFTLSTFIDYGHKSNVLVRGGGANSTFIVFTAGATGINCGAGQTALIGICSSDGTYWVPGTVYNWTAGYAQGTNQITLSSTANIRPNSTILILDQCDDGKTGSSCRGTSVDTGNYYNCSDIYTAAPSGCSYNGPDSGNGRTGRFQTELFQVTAVNSGTGVVTLSHPLRNPNWSSGQAPQAWFVQPIQYSGLEYLSIDASAARVGQTVQLWNSANCWIKGVRIVGPGTFAIAEYNSVHFQFEQNYIYKPTASPSIDNGSFHQTIVGDCLIQNNISQQTRFHIFDEGPDNGCVIAYNFLILDFFPSDNMSESIRPHAGGDSFQLIEGNVAPIFYNENFHGTHPMETAYRNLFTGWESCGSGQCGIQPAKDSGTVAIAADPFNRYGNSVGNVLGTPLYHTSYQCMASPCPTSRVVYILGAGASGFVPPDPLVASTMLRWGNYDVVTGATRFCGSPLNTGWLTTCAGILEVPFGISSFPNLLPTLGDTAAGQSAMPASFYLSSKPSWFGSTPFPAIGPDISGGNVGVCSGALNTPGQFAGVPATQSSQCTGTSLVFGWAGHVNAIPAMHCALDVMGMPPDGSGPALGFDAKACYGGSSSDPNPPTNLTVVVN
jgi:hypothetical protein